MVGISGIRNIIGHFPTAQPTQPKGSAQTSDKTSEPGVQASASTTKSRDGAASSQPKPFVEIASNARKALDAKYEHLGLSSGMYLHKTGNFRRDMFDAMGFDRRTLFAISSNEGGQFSKEEIKAAKSVMRTQLTNAMKAVGGLTGHNGAAGHKAAAEFLDTAASPEEKLSFDWARERASAQVTYQMANRGRGENIESDNSVVRHLVTAYRELFLAYEKDMGSRWEDMPSYARALQESMIKAKETRTFSKRV